MSTISWRQGVLLSLLPLCGCAQNDNRTPAPDGGQRIVLTTRGEYPSTAQVATHVTQLTQVPVSDIFQVAPRIYRVTLGCGDRAACRAVAQRIADDYWFALAVEVDGRQMIPVKPTRESAR
jgi:hypothetical protein